MGGYQIQRDCVNAHGVKIGESTRGMTSPCTRILAQVPFCNSAFMSQQWRKKNGYARKTCLDFLTCRPWTLPTPKPMTSLTFSCHNVQSCRR